MNLASCLLFLASAETVHIFKMWVKRNEDLDVILAVKHELSCCVDLSICS